jgi:hypothetical protein
VEEVLAAGIDVFSTLNVQHLESLNDLVAGFTRVRVRETLPDRVLDRAEIEVVDIPPDELIARLKAGKVYVPQEASRALAHFFSRQNLSALRELALRARRRRSMRRCSTICAPCAGGHLGGGRPVLVAVSGGAGADEVVRAGKRLADAARRGARCISKPPRRARPPRPAGGRGAASGQPAWRAGGHHSRRLCGRRAGAHGGRQPRHGGGAGRRAPPLVGARAG